MRLLTLSTVEVDDSKDISRAALCAIVETGAWVVDLAVLNLHGGGGECRNGSEDGDGEELHDERCLCCWGIVLVGVLERENRRAGVSGLTG